ncbi:zinc finger MYM-type 1-like [Paramuricea clavata]|uniref:Zinc finger MYM-type 1-like n=1 Tax=Paramuricea clavata TaxID=317549 RepID=A0A6S7LID2_PARCT|nr:zinc finger MYM-type 1-like [Paramuricea clavata]
MSQTEQLSLLVRFVWNGEVEERLLAMMPMNETTAEALFEAVTQKLQQHGIDVAHLRGQCYDGANNVAGSCPKRHSVYVKNQREINAHAGGGEKMEYTLKKLSDTRWACRADSIVGIHRTLDAVIATLKEVRENETKAAIAAEAKGLLQNVQDFEFIVALEVLKKVLHLRKGVSDKVQSEGLDVVSGCERVADLLTAIKALRCDVPRRLDENPDTAAQVSVKDKFKIFFFYNVLDLMSNSIETRFNMENTAVLKGLGYLHPARISHSQAWESISVAVKWFQNDIDLESEIFSLQLSSLVTDVIEKAVSEKRNPDFLDLFKALQAEPQCYGCVSKLMKIALTLPITSCSAERVFSKLKIVKSRLRSTMNQNRLENLIHMSVEVDLLENLDLDSLVQKFTDCAPRRMNLV